VQLDADPLRINQVLSNLLTNAIKYTQPGGRIALEVTLEGGQAVITVRDNGVGMKPQDIERMFEMFAQADAPGNRGNAGLGIGLALVRSIVELHGGTVDASSPGPGQGSELRVRLPASRAPATVAAAGGDAAAGGAAATERSARKRGLILIADDNVDAGWGMANLLAISGFESVRVQGGADAVRECARQRPDVAILDIGMPDLNGHEVARQIRDTAWGRQMVLIAATGWGQEADERKALEAGFDAHMTKPVDLRKLGALVDALLERRGR
jgi:two-component system CheB/CheR fusion protein